MYGLNDVQTRANKKIGQQLAGDVGLKVENVCVQHGILADVQMQFVDTSVLETLILGAGQGSFRTRPSSYG